MIRDAVLHLRNEQPLFVDLFDRPSATDTILICTNVRTTAGLKPQWVDDRGSVFLFPFSVVRFVEIHPGAEGVAGPPAASEADAGSAGEWTATAADAEGDLELDEELLRRVREA